jgi:hypothetical protein
MARPTTKAKADRLASTRLRPRKNGDPEQAHPGVTTGGECAPGKERDNLKRYGFPSPHAHFVLGPPDLTGDALAKIWGINRNTVYAWIHRHDWTEERETRLQCTALEHGGKLETDKIKLLREQHTEQSYRVAQNILNAIEDKLQCETEQVMSPTGEIKDMQRSPAQLKALAATARDADEQARMALGMPTKMTGAFAGATIVDKQINMAVVEAPVGAYMPGAGVKALLDGETIEGEVED